MVTKLNDGAPPANVICPVPPNTTVPLLEKLVPRNVNVTAFVGKNCNVPLLVTLPPLVKSPLIEWGKPPPANVEPLATVKEPLIVHP